MTPARFQRIRELFETVLDLSPEHRESYLQEIAGDDPDLIAEVGRLLVAKEQTIQVLGDALLLPVESQPSSSEGWVFEPADRVGDRFEVRSCVGKGGMGEVYCALDLRLNRTVALKVIRSSLANQMNFRLRLEQEARAISALNHPNICQLFDIRRHQDIDYLVMEYLEGETLAMVLSRGPLPLENLLAIGSQIGDALEFAHQMGLIHRDIKPSNIIITASGVAKVTDFGLARRIAVRQQDTLSINTLPGAILGTVSYMSPEQARGEPLDARSDLFSFGTVLYEAACGVHPFDRPTQIEVLMAILTAPITPPKTHRPEIPAGLQDILTRALAKDKEARFQSVRDMLSAVRDVRKAATPMEDIDALAETGLRDTGFQPMQRRRARQKSLRFVVIAMVLVTVTAGLTWKNWAGLHSRVQVLPAIPSAPTKTDQHEVALPAAPQANLTAPPEKPPKQTRTTPVPKANVVTKEDTNTDYKSPSDTTPTEGRLVWAGELETGQQIDLGADSGIGSISGGLPGVPVTIEIHPMNLEVVSPPGPDNQWHHLVVRNRGQKLAVIVVKWVRIKG
jgi:serine/threonine protein kinase